MPHARRNPHSNPKTASWLAVVRAYQTCERQYARLLLAFDLSISQFDVLTAIADLDTRATPAQIAQRLLVTKGNISGLLKRLGERDLVDFCRHASDGRSFLCALTPRAIALLVQAREASSRFIDAQLSPFTDAQLAATRRQMDQMRLHLEGIDPDAIAATALKPSRSGAHRKRHAPAR